VTHEKKLSVASCQQKSFAPYTLDFGLCTSQPGTWNLKLGTWNHGDDSLNWRIISWLLATGCWLLLPSCALFDNTKLEQQRVQIEQLRRESAQLRQEADAIRNQREKEERERAACNRAFASFTAARKAPDDASAITHYREGLDQCPSDDVAHNELGELYARMGRTAEARAEFEAALKLNPNFTRAQKNLESLP
jgi:tetratricopeptide (TPR) repeat protein